MTNEELAASIQAGDTWRLDTLLTQNNGMLYHIARQYSGLAERNRGADLEDLYQSAALGMIEAVAEWEPERGAFLTVATFYMRRRVRELLGVYSTKERIENGGTASLDAAISAEDESPLVELIADPAALDPEEAAIQADMRRIVREAVAALPAEECAAINNTYLQEGKRGGADGKRLTRVCVPCGETAAFCSFGRNMKACPIGTEVMHRGGTRTQARLRRLQCSGNGYGSKWLHSCGGIHAKALMRLFMLRSLEISCDFTH